ncbi:MAG: beta-galactosidase trimerization domain-containing protein, partial [Candidatus Hydrogenedentota bacterium]
RAGWEAIGAEGAEWVGRAFGAGVGFVFVGFDPADAGFLGEAATGTPEYLARGGAGADDAATVRAYESDASRAVSIVYGRPSALLRLLPEPLDVADGSLINAETHYALLARVLRWAARRDPAVHITSIGPVRQAGADPAAIPPFLPPEYAESLTRTPAMGPITPFELRLNGPADRAYSLRVQARYPRSDTRWWMELDKPIAKGLDRTTLFLPTGQGQPNLDVWLGERKGVADSFSARVDLAGWPRISEFRCLRKIATPNDSIPLAIAIETDPQAPGVATVFLRATDGWGRVIAEHAVGMASGVRETTGYLNIADALSPFLRIDAFAVAGAQEELNPTIAANASHAVDFAIVSLPPRDAFVLAVETTPTLSYLDQDRLRALEGLGSSAVMSEITDAAPFASAAANFGWALRAGRIERTASGYPLGLSMLGTAGGSSTEAAVERIAPVAAGCVVIGEDAPLAESWDVEEESLLPDFARFLERRYLDLSELNGRWKTGWATWREAADALAAYKEGDQVWAARLERRLFEESLEREIVERGAGAVRQRLPRIPAGLIARESGHDWGALLRHGLLAAVSSSGWDRAAPKRYGVRDVLPLALVGPDDDLGASVWKAMLNGYGGIVLERPFDDGEAALLDAYGTPTSRVNVARGALDAASLGAGTLLRMSAPVTPKVAILCGHVNAEVAEVRGLADWAPAIRRALEQLHVPFGFAGADDQLDAYDVLVLPSVYAVSDGEAQFLRGFGEQGKAFVFGVDPGAYDEFGWLRSSPALADLTAQQESKLLRLEWDQNAAEPALGPEAMTRLGAWLDERGIARTGSGLLERPIESDWVSGEYAYGSARILALFRGAGSEDKKCGLRFAKELHVYDALAGMPVLGRKASAQLAEGEAAIFCALPYEVTRLEVTAPETVSAGRRLAFSVSVKTAEALPGDHLVRVSFSRIGEAAPAYYSRDVACPGGQATGYFPIARNERPGFYTLVARDVLTGATVRARVEVAGT